MVSLKTKKRVAQAAGGLVGKNLSNTIFPEPLKVVKPQPVEQNLAEVIPEKKIDAQSATKNFQKETVVNPDGSVTEKFPTGEVVNWSKQQWESKLGAQFGRGGFAATNSEQAAANKLTQAISALRQPDEKTGKQLSYEEIFNKLSSDRQFLDELETLKTLAGQQIDVPAFQENPQNFEQQLAFAGTGAAGGVSGIGAGIGAVLGGAAGAGFGAIPGAIAGQTVETGVKFVQGLLAARSFQKEENINKASTQLDRSMLNARNLAKLANTNNYDRMSLLQAYRKQKADISSAESYLKQLQQEQKLDRVSVSAELQKILEYREMEPFLDQAFFGALLQNEAGTQDLSFLNEQVVAGGQ